MLSSKRDRFVWSKQDRMPDVSYFRQLHQNWHPTTRVVVVEEQLTVTERHMLQSGVTDPHHRARRGAWNPWLWVGS